jgi:hypothetical protein
MKGETAGFIFEQFKIAKGNNQSVLGWWALAIEYFSTCSNRI